MSEKKQHTSSAQNAGPLRDENPFLPLDDIVFAPVRALAASNANLSMSVLEEIRRMGTVKKQDGKDVLHLTNLNLIDTR